MMDAARGDVYPRMTATDRPHAPGFQADCRSSSAAP